MSELFVSNPNLFLAIFAGVQIFFAAGFVALKVHTANRQKALRSRGDTAELIFNAVVRPASNFATDIQFTGYKIYAVNGREPETVGRSIFVEAGPCEIELEYIDTDYVTRKRSVTTVYPKRTVALDAHPGGQYRVLFDEGDCRFAVAEG